MSNPQVRFIFNIALTLALLFVLRPAAAEKNLLFADDYAQVAKNWRAVNDTVMGGVSKGGATLNKIGHVVFEGDLSLDNNGGFASIRSRDQRNLLAGNDTITVRVKGDGRTYYLSLRDRNRRMAASHRFPIQTVKGQWITATASLDDFYYTSFGNRQNRPALEPDEVIGIGFTLADKNPGPFKLQIASLTATTSSATASPADAIASTPGDILDLAKKAGQFSTLLAALQAADLDEALRGQSATLTVFAPTDDAFAKLPKGTVQSLLQPENRDQLRSILLNHIVMDELSLQQQVKTLAGTTVAIQPANGFKVGDATVIAANLRATNGLVHVIDTVLLPEMDKMTPHDRVMQVYDQAIARGIPAYNNGDPAKCAEIYKQAVTTLMHDHKQTLGRHNQRMLERTMQAIDAGNHSARDQAWALRGALDAVYTAMAETTD